MSSNNALSVSISSTQSQEDEGLSSDIHSSPCGIVTLKEQCEQKWKELEAEAEIVSLISDVKTVQPRNSLLQILQEKKKHLQAEINVLKTTKPDPLPPDPDVQFEVLTRDLLSSIKQLEETFSLAISQDLEVKNSVEREKEYREQLLIINHHLEERVQSFQDEPMGNDPLSTVFKELKSKIKKAELMDKKLSKQFDEFLSSHFPLPSDDDIRIFKKNMRSRNKFYGSNHLYSLKSILEELMNKCIEEPNDPYVTINDCYWPPYIELLVRCQIILQHPDHDKKIKLVPFHL